MKKMSWIIILIITLSLGFLSCQTLGQKVMNREYDYEVLLSEQPSVSLLILFDNISYNLEMEISNSDSNYTGFSCLIVTSENTILFDTGQDNNFILKNMEALGVDPSIVDTVVISHVHMDHLGGIEGFLAVNPNVDVYIPSGWYSGFRDLILNSGAECIEVSEPMEIVPGVYTTGPLPSRTKSIRVVEQSLAVEITDGYFIISGCSHPGSENIVRKTKTMLPDKTIQLYIGGFHEDVLYDSRCYDLCNELHSLGVKRVAPSHCSGDMFISIAEEMFEQNYVKSGLGIRIKI